MKRTLNLPGCRDSLSLMLRIQYAQLRACEVLEAINSGGEVAKYSLSYPPKGVR